MRPVYLEFIERSLHLQMIEEFEDFEDFGGPELANRIIYDDDMSCDEEEYIEPEEEDTLI